MASSLAWKSVGLFSSSDLPSYTFLSNIVTLLLIFLSAATLITSASAIVASSSDLLCCSWVTNHLPPRRVCLIINLSLTKPSKTHTDTSTMSEPQPLMFCVNGCKMTKQEKKCVVTLKRYPYVCKNQPSWWKVIRDQEQQRRLEEETTMTKAEVIRAAAAKKMSKKVARLAKKVYKGKSEEEKRPTDFQADDDAIMMGKGVTMKKALKTSNYVQMTT
nr:hypothetical protein [Tanacetum cinerariifolium]